jgi:hypothetical protein
LHCIHFFSEDLCFSSHILPGSQFGYMASEPAAERNTGDVVFPLLETKSLLLAKARCLSDQRTCSMTATADLTERVTSFGLSKVTHFGIPVSMTHTITGAIGGRRRRAQDCGRALERGHRCRPGLGHTLPAAALFGVAFYEVYKVLSCRAPRE